MTKVLIVTGGGRGIGAEIASQAAARSYAVCVNYHRNADAANDVVDRIEQSGGRAIAVQADVSSEPDVIRLFETTERELGELTALVNNAGILLKQMSLRDMSADRINRVLSVNVTGSFLCAREAVRRMSTSSGGRGGAIVNISSLAATLGAPNEYIDYAASKGAIDTLTTGLAKEVAADSIRVNAVRPGIIKTDIHASGGEPGRVERVSPSIPMQRAGEAGEVAGAVLWLLSDEASYITGAILDVSGGR